MICPPCDRAGKVLIPTSAFVRTLIAARLAADVCVSPFPVQCGSQKSVSDTVDYNIERRRTQHT